MTANMSHYITTKTAQHSTTHPPDGAQDGPDDGVADCGGVDEVGAQEAPQVAAYHTKPTTPLGEKTRRQAGTAERHIA